MFKNFTANEFLYYEILFCLINHCNYFYIVIYIALSVGGPIAGYLLRKYEHKTVIGHAVVANTVLTFLWASTPVQYSFSKALFISLRFVMGLAQCFLCVFLPLWINEYAPGHRRTSWMGYLQVSDLIPHCLLCLTNSYIKSAICSLFTLFFAFRIYLGMY